MNPSRWLRPRLLGLVVVMLALLGVASYLTMARQEDPSFPYRAGMITVIYPGAVAESVERLIVEPLADELSQVEEVDFISATARTGWHWSRYGCSTISTIPTPPGIACARQLPGRSWSFPRACKALSWMTA